MKITKREFVEAMTGNLTHFVGLSRVFDLDYYKSFFDEAIPDWKQKGAIIEKRSCVARSKDLVFSDGSHLDLTRREFYKVIGSCYVLYVCVEKWFDKWDEKEMSKSMIYMIMD